MDNKIKIIYALEATAGGTKKHLLDLALNLDQEIFDISIICSTRRDRRFLQDIEYMRGKNINIKIIEMTRTINPAMDLLAFYKILRYFRNHTFDILHAHSSKAGFICRLASKLAHISPVIYSPHCYYFYQKKGLLRWFFLRLERFAGLFTNKIVAVSEGERKLTVEEHIVGPADVVRITNGIDTSKYDFQPNIAEIKNKLGIESDSPVVGTISRYSKQKGFNIFFGAASIIKKRYPQAVFLFVGQKNNDMNVQKLIKELNISSRTLLIDHSDFIQEYISVMDVFVLTSLWEGMPYALLEAMAMKKPVVASNITGVKEVVKHNETGYLVNAGDTEAFADHIVKVLDNPVEAAGMGMEGRNIIERDYRLETQIKTLTDLYKDLLRVNNIGVSNAGTNR